LLAGGRSKDSSLAQEPARSNNSVKPMMDAADKNILVMLIDFGWFIFNW